MKVLVGVCNLFLVYRFVQHGLVRSNWRKRGVFRWHIIPGTALTLLVPYSSWYLGRLEAPPLAICFLAGALLVLVSVSGLRMISLLKKRDTRIRRTFSGLSFGFLNSGFIVLSYTAWLQKSEAWAVLGRVFAVLALLCALIFVYLVILEILSSLRPVAPDVPEDHQVERVSRPSRSDFMAIFRLRRREDGPTILYGSLGPKLAVPYANVPAVMIAMPGFIIPYHLLTHPSATLWQEMNGIIAVGAAVAIFNLGLAAWAVFELTLYIRKKTGDLATLAMFPIFFILPNVPSVLAYMCLVDAGPWDALLAGLLFER